jgi:polyisoprenoid-binding protein YceI
MRFYFLSIALLIASLASAQIAKLQEASIQFTSKAKAEQINASTSKLNGAIDLTKNNFSFQVSVASFIGFNSSTQQTHFYENYLETDLFPKATFNGKIIEEIDYSKKGIVEVRAKGILLIHGVAKERILKITLNIQEKKITFKAKFDVYLKDHNISIPRIVNDKLSSVIMVNAQGTFLK